MLDRERRSIDEAFSRLGYPEDFLSDYDQLECLSARRGRETFLVRSRADGSLAVAKCYDRGLYDFHESARDPTEGLEHPGLPRFRRRYVSDACLCVVRDYVEGVPLSERVRETPMDEREVAEVCGKLCAVLIYLHEQSVPVIHRDIKPENVILTPDGGVCLIDFDIARTFKPEAESDTRFFGTRGYAPPEQYGFAQTDARTDEYSFGVLLRFLLTGSVRENKNVRFYPPLERVVARCTSFAPEKRYPDMRAVQRALRRADPRRRSLRRALRVLAALAAAAALILGTVLVYRAATYTPFTEGHVPGYLADADRVAEAAAYMTETYGTSLFSEPDDFASVGLLRAALIECYGLDREYVYAVNEDFPQESEDFFLPWGWDDGQTLDRDIAVYAAVKVHDPALVADWSGLRDDNGHYPGVRVAVAYADKTGIAEGVNRPNDLTVGELALILANADRVFGVSGQSI